jgi:anthranilate synthase component 2
MILVIDNYDSFTFNLVQLIGRVEGNVMVRRNDQITVDEIRTLAPRGIVISPGPGRPENAGISVDVIRRIGPTTPVLGVCLGHQGIGVAFGGKVVHAPTLMHGKTSQVFHSDTQLYRDVPSPFTATRYHSLVVSPEGFPQDLEVTARTEDGVIMGLRHRRFPIEGVQFHPESILTEKGEQMVRNWLEGTQGS